MINPDRPLTRQELDQLAEISDRPWWSQSAHWTFIELDPKHVFGPIDWSRFDRQLDCVPPPKRCAGAEDDDDDLKAREPTAEQLFGAWERVRRRDPLWPSTLRRY